MAFPDCELWEVSAGTLKMPLLDKLKERFIELEMFDELDLLLKLSWESQAILGERIFNFNLFLKSKSVLNDGKRPWYIPCETSTQRRIVHAIAEAWGLYHGTWIDYRYLKSKCYGLEERYIWGVWICKYPKITTEEDKKHQILARRIWENQKAHRRSKRKKICEELLAWYWSPEGPGYQEARESFENVMLRTGRFL